MKQITNQLSDVILKQANRFKNDKTLENFEKSLKEYKEMVKSGLATPRGNQLRTLEESHLKTISFNNY